MRLRRFDFGAHYYLKVRQLLRSNSDKTIKQSDYIKIVADLEREFVQGIQKNIRSRVIGSFWVNLKMAFLSDYSRTERLGELYEKYLYSQTENRNETKFWLNDLFIHPQGEPATFRPKYHNWRRCAKVPMLVLNATTLNTGHNWQFTASWMGEPPISGRRRRRYELQIASNVLLGSAGKLQANPVGLCRGGLVVRPIPLRSVESSEPLSG